MNVDYPELLSVIDFYVAEKRNESASFLMWFLEKYYRLDSQEAIDSVCDQKNDKGVDGIYVNEASGTIDIFQSKISQSPNKTIGDVVLKEFYGTLSQFESKEKLESLVNEAGRAQVASLVRRLDLISKIGAYSVRGFFIANTNLALAGKEYLDKTNQITFLGKDDLINQYISDSKNINYQSEAIFDISGTEVTTYYVDTDTKTFIAPVRANELVKLHGIENQSIFDYNVRGSLGNTKINKGIVRSIKDSTLHKKFPLFHNGITIVANDAERTEDEIKLKQFYVVNGCQSLTTLYKNQAYLTDDLKILTKIIKVPINSDLSSQITEYSNSQNGVKPRDFKSYNQIQIRLQNEINSKFEGAYFFEIKRGELNPNEGEIISNELAGIHLMSFDLKTPWNTHRKYQVFEDSYNQLFARPEVNADRIVFLHILSELIDKKRSNLDNQMIAKYLLTKYAIMYMVRNILEKDEKGASLIQSPSLFLSDKGKIEVLKRALSIVIDDIIIDLNGEVNNLGEDFDYKSRLRDDTWVKKLSNSIVSNYQKLVNRGRISAFKDELSKSV